MLLDTSGFYCCLDAGDARHHVAVSLLDSAARRLTHSCVLAELVALCNARGLDRRVSLGFITELTNDASIMVVWIGEEAHRSAVKFLQSRPDKGYSLCDAVSFLLMRQHGMTEALTTDRHFDQEGFVRLLNP